MTGPAAVERAKSLIEFNKVHKDLGPDGFRSFGSASIRLKEPAPSGSLTTFLSRHRQSHLRTSNYLFLFNVGLPDACAPGS